MDKQILAFITSAILGLIIMPLIIKFYKKYSYSQTILDYVKEHKDKQGTATMGGVLFFICTLLTVPIFLKYSTDWVMALAVGIGFGIIGFMDDFIKIKYKQNLGLRPYQKIVGQLLISVVLAIYIYKISPVGSTLFWFGGKSFSIGFWIIPLVVLVCLACTNSVNLTDGLDGLAGSVSLIVSLVFSIIFVLFKDKLLADNLLEMSNVFSNMSTLLIIFAGSLFAFLVFNTNKASIFMGDTGSLGIGGLLSSAVCITGCEIFLPFVGIMFVITTLSVIIQVLYYKKTKKRIFKMAPLHHHFQMSGFKEPKIVMSYLYITVIVGLLIITFVV